MIAPSSHEAQPSNHETALHIAARVGHERVVDALLQGVTRTVQACMEMHRYTVPVAVVTYAIQCLLALVRRLTCANAGVVPCDASSVGWVLSTLVKTGALKWFPRDTLGRN